MVYVEYKLLCVAGGNVLLVAETHDLGDLEGNVDAAHDTAEVLVAGAPGVDGNIDERVDTLALTGGNVTGHGETLGVVLGVEPVSSSVLHSGDTLVVVVDDKVLTLVGESRPAVGDRVAGVPSDGESIALGTLEGLVRVGVDVLGDSVGGETRVLVGTDGAALSTVGLLGLEELGVGRAEDVESVAVVGSDNDKSLFELANLLEVLKSSAESVVELEEVTKSTVNVLDVHLLVDESSLGHEGPSGTTRLGTSGEDVNSLEGHLLESGLVVSTLGAVGLDSKVESVGVDMLVKPGGDVTLGEDGKSTVVVVESLELGVAVANLVPGLAPTLKLRDVAVCGTGEEVLGTTAEEKVNSLPGVPGVVAGDTNEVLLDNGVVLRTLRGVGADSGRGSIGNVSLGDDTDLATSGTTEHLENGLHLGVAEGLAGGVGVSVETVDSHALATCQMCPLVYSPAEESRSRVGRVGDERVERVGHLRSVGRCLVHLKESLVFTVNRLVSKKTSSGDHRSSHAVTDKVDEVLGLGLLGKGKDLPDSLGLLATVVGELDIVFAGVVQLDVAVRLGKDVDGSLGTGYLSKEVLVPSEVVRLDWGLVMNNLASPSGSLRPKNLVTSWRGAPWPAILREKLGSGLPPL